MPSPRPGSKMPEPFRCTVPETAINDLNARLDATRWPSVLDAADWDFGVPLSAAQQLISHWRHKFDWRAAEARLNELQQFLVQIEDLSTHFIHQRSPHAGAVPLLLVHGWPGSVVEFLEVIPRLTEPEKFGGRPEDAFHVVCPSLPGYGFSEAPTSPGMGPRAIAARHLELMSLLGYERFIAQGGDWGAIINRYLPDLAPERLLGIHFNLLTCRKPKGVPDPMSLLTPAEAERFHRDQARMPELLGYQAIQGTKPQTLAYGLMDSPVGCAAWIAEKFQDWTDNNGDMRDALSFDQVLANIALYWFTGTIGSSVRLYRELRLEQARGERTGPRVDVPTGVALYPREIWTAPKAWMEREYNLIHWYEAEKGGHFAAFEQPAAFAADLWNFAAAIRTGAHG